MNYITPASFINTVFPPDELAGTRVMVTRQLRPNVWQNLLYSGRRRRSITVGESPWYYCISSIRAGATRRDAHSIAECWVIPCDDIGTKATAPPIEPSYSIETSAGNYQYGYLIEPFDVSCAAGRATVDNVLYSLAQAGHNDPGCRNATRVVRLPGSLHSTGHVAAVDIWRPERVWSLPELLPQMGVSPRVSSSGRRGAPPGAGEYTSLSEVVDPIYHWLVAQGRVLSHNQDWVHINCPWRGGHTDGAQGPTSTSYSPDGYGRAGRGFKCHHGHCAGRSSSDFMTWIMRKMNDANAE